jgi:hypothetical protein
MPRIPVESEMVHTLLGLVAAANLRLSRIRINFLPVNVILVGVLIWEASLGLRDLQGPYPDTMSTGVLRIGLCAPILILFFVSAVKRHTIFQPSHDSQVPPLMASFEPIDLRVTATLTRDAREARRFVEVPAGVVVTNGEAMLHSDIDTSSSFMGMTTNAQLGMWTVFLPPGTPTAVTRGHVYYGWAKRPAAQFRIASGTRRLRQTVTLSFATIEQRERLLQHLAGSAARRAA